MSTKAVFHLNLKIFECGAYSIRNHYGIVIVMVSDLHLVLEEFILAHLFPNIKFQLRILFLHNHFQILDKLDIYFVGN